MLVRRIALVVLATLLVGACEVTTDISVDVEPDGSGTVAVTVALDAAAVERLERISGGPVGDALVVDDLVAAGWESSGVVRDGEAASIVLTHGFANPEEAVTLLDGLTGSSGLVGGLELERERTWLRSRDAASLTLDFADVSSTVLDDGDVVAALEGAGVDPAAVELLLTADAIEGLRLRATVAVEGDRDTAEAGFGESATVEASAEQFHAGRAAMAAGAGVLALVALVALVGAGVSFVRARRADRA